MFSITNHQEKMNQNHRYHHTSLRIENEKMLAKIQRKKFLCTVDENEFSITSLENSMEFP